MEAFTLRNLSFSYPGSAQKVLDGVTFSVGQGEFLVLCGPSGCGKTTLLRQLKPILAPHGAKSGEILFEGVPLESLDQRAQCLRIGFVQQNPESQIVTDKVWHELAFGLESLGCDTDTIRRRVAEMASFFGIQTWFHQDVSELSGGQKQLLNLASVMAMQPAVLILDEPTSQLDPIAASEFLGILGKINRELGVTVILTEHRLEEAFPLASRVAVMENGKILCAGTAKEVGEELRRRGNAMLSAMPAAMRVWAAAGGGEPCPVTVREGREWLETFAANHPLKGLPPEPPCVSSDQTAFEAKELWFKYEKDAPDIVKGLSLSVKKGEFLALLGGNGTGKTTSLKLMAGLLKPYRGEIHACGTISMLPQSPQTLFVKKTVGEDLSEIFRGKKLSEEAKNAKVASAAALCRLEGLLDRHPYDLSGGEQQRAALAKVLLSEPEILLLDEPTKGFDAEFKQVFAEILQSLLLKGIAIVMVSHDVEFCARHAHCCALFFDGNIVAKARPRAFFSENSFYTTSANRMARHLLPAAVTAEDVIFACGGQIPIDKTPKSPPVLPKQSADSGPQSPEKVSLKKRRLPTRTVVSVAVVLFLIPLTLFVGEHFLASRKYYFISLLVLLECMAPFFLVFEGRRPQARELVTLAVLCALGVAGRAAFFFLPQFKPVIAITIIAGASFGGETGFLVGAVIMLVSNMIFGQGPMTPWQMFAMGMIGFCAGLLLHRSPLRKNRGVLCVFGALSAILLYGGIMNSASALIWAHTINIETLLPYYISGFPFDCIQAAATVLFLWFAAKPVLEKLDRIKMKYGLGP